MNRLEAAGLRTILADHFPEDSAHWLDSGYDYGWEGPPRVRCKCDTFWQSEDDWCRHLSEVLEEVL